MNNLSALGCLNPSRRARINKFVVFYGVISAVADVLIHLDRTGIAYDSH